MSVTAVSVSASLPVPESTTDRHGDETNAAERETCYVDVHQNDEPFATGEREARILCLCSNAMHRHGGGNTAEGVLCRSVLRILGPSPRCAEHRKIIYHHHLVQFSDAELVAAV